MTCKEKFEQEYPGFDYTEFCTMESRIADKPEYCMSYADDYICEDCWNREIPEETEKEKAMTNTKKTKAELLNEIAELQKQVEGLEKYKQYQDCADELKALHTSFMNAGFSNEQAFTMVQTMFQSAVLGNLAGDISKAVIHKR